MSPNLIRCLGEREPEILKKWHERLSVCAESFGQIVSDQCPKTLRALYHEFLVRLQAEVQSDPHPAVVLDLYQKGRHVTLTHNLCALMIGEEVVDELLMEEAEKGKNLNYDELSKESEKIGGVFDDLTRVHANHVCSDCVKSFDPIHERLIYLEKKVSQVSQKFKQKSGNMYD